MSISVLPRKPIHAGMLVERVAFQRRLPADDGAGNTIGDWDVAGEIVRPAAYLMRPGSEAVLAARLASEQPVTIITYWDSATSQIKGGDTWRVVDETDGTTFEIKAAADMDRKRQWLTLICEAGALA